LVNGRIESKDGWKIEDHLLGKPDENIRLFRRFVELVEACGPFTYAVSKTTITFKGTRRGFAGARPTAGGLRGYLDLRRRVSDNRISNVSPYTKRLFVHHFRIATASEMDGEFAAWVAEAYDVGQGAHVTERHALVLNPQNVPNNLPSGNGMASNK
jgi:hypothetical protein